MKYWRFHLFYLDLLCNGTCLYIPNCLQLCTKHLLKDSFFSPYTGAILLPEKKKIGVCISFDIHHFSLLPPRILSNGKSIMECLCQRSNRPTSPCKQKTAFGGLQPNQACIALTLAEFDRDIHNGIVPSIAMDEILSSGSTTGDFLGITLFKSSPKY